MIMDNQGLTFYVVTWDVHVTSAQFLNVLPINAEATNITDLHRSAYRG